ncbi:1123_t:CDS:2 [Dentiscutata erythropus]|uniref:1123_t:CDS:1 n=1 Tax=Dentiscutata erythropus TaxID=1348616 RepID=A0A9N9A4Y5_9GLOM|nr:1123_t:CDS:2 [Dentiscutata erythropus]
MISISGPESIARINEDPYKIKSVQEKYKKKYDHIDYIKM